jgi:hypothetical protein
MALSQCACAFFAFAAAISPLRAQTPSGTARQFPKPDRIRYDDFRVPRELWRDRFQKIKAAGIRAFP